MVHIYCGDGKGKTTAAMGLAVRMAGSGGKVVIGQFFKDGSSSEIGVLKTVPGITLCHCKTIPGRYKNLTEPQREQVRLDYTAYLNDLLDLAEGADLLILDEAISACNHGIIPEQRITEFLSTHTFSMEIVLTGRNPSDNLMALADYVTEMCKRKHPFDCGIPARQGIEY